MSGDQFHIQLDVHWSVQHAPTSNSNRNWHDKQYANDFSLYLFGPAEGEHVIARFRLSVDGGGVYEKSGCPTN